MVDEGGEARQDFRFPVCAEALKLEVSFQPGEEGLVGFVPLNDGFE